MKKIQLTRIPNSVTAALGFRAGGIAAGIKSNKKKDLALIESDVLATVAATFTKNQIKAAPVKLDIEHLKQGRARAIIINSGNANACTGRIGILHAKAMAHAVASRIQCDLKNVFVCSTGRIGIPLPIVKVEAGIKKLITSVSRKGSSDAARAIMTSDTVPKECAVQVKAKGKTIHIGGIAKGAGMIHPNMATMLSFITTDAAIPQKALQRALNIAVNQSFNQISVDGDESTNDTVILMANGVAGPVPMSIFQVGLNLVCLELAKQIVQDGEGVSKFVTVNVKGAKSARDAEFAARSIANSVLVKTSWCGGDPNWGRIMDALGYSKAKVDESKVDIAYDKIFVVRRGVSTKTPVHKIKQITAKSSFTIDIYLRLGNGEFTMHSTDLTERYVTFNKSE